MHPSHLGELALKGEIPRGEPPAILDRDLFDAVQARPDEQATNREAARMKSPRPCWLAATRSSQFRSVRNIIQPAPLHLTPGKASHRACNKLNSTSGPPRISTNHQKIVKRDAMISAALTRTKILADKEKEIMFDSNQCNVAITS